MRSLSSAWRISFRSLALSAAFMSIATLGGIACSPGGDEDAGDAAHALTNHADEAHLRDGTADARGVLAVVNDRWLSLDDYVYGVRISSVLAQAIIDARNGTNGRDESRPIWWGDGSSSGSGGTPLPSGSGNASAGSSGGSTEVDGGTDPTVPKPWPNPPYCSGPDPLPGSSGGSTNPFPGSSSGDTGSSDNSSTDAGYPSYPCHPNWQLGGDDEEFTRLREVDALPGSDVSAFHRLRDFARKNGYVHDHDSAADAGTGPGPWPNADGGPDPWPNADGGTGPGPWPTPTDAGRP